MKLDTGKAPIARGFARYFPRAIAGVALISQFGFEKYGEWGGWKKVEDAYNRYDDAHGRHDNALQRGETHCPESHKLHLAHRAWNALATYELYLIEEEAKRGEASIEQERKDQSWADAANADHAEKAATFETLKAQTKAYCKHCDEFVVAPCDKEWAPGCTNYRTPGVFAACGRCKTDTECASRGYCLA